MDDKGFLIGRLPALLGGEDGEMRRAMKLKAVEDGKPLPAEENAACYREVMSFASTYLRKHEFEPGQAVQWKPEMRDRNLPRYGQPAVVLEVLREPVVCRDDPTRNIAPDQYDLILAIMCPDGFVFTVMADSRRYEPYTGATFESLYGDEG